VIVVDASVLAPALADDDADGDRARKRLRGEQLVAPELVDVRRSGQALDDLAALPLRRVSHLALLPRVWELRDNLSAYDAAYVALAEALGALLLTADGGMKKASGVRCEVEVLE
jgi:predicted nucleic acid-binding protein